RRKLSVRLRGYPRCEARLRRDTIAPDAHDATCPRYHVSRMPRGPERQHRPRPQEARMIYHIVRMTFRPEVPPDEREAGIERLRRYPQEIDVIQAWSVGRDIGGEFEYGAMYALADIEA